MVTTWYPYSATLVGLVATLVKSLHSLKLTVASVAFEYRKGPNRKVALKYPTTAKGN